jgi:hypothetical protein
MARHELPYPAGPGRSRPDSVAPSPVHPRHGGTLEQRIAANREGIEALKAGTARLRARVDPRREHTIARLSRGTPGLAARVARDSRPREWS